MRNRSLRLMHTASALHPCRGTGGANCVGMLRVHLENGRVKIGEHFSISFQRTVRVPDDGKIYPLPPGLGPLPIHDVRDFAGQFPASWLGRESHFFIPMYQREALWLGFGGAFWKPNAVKIAAGRRNALTGESWTASLHAHPQDYLVCPDQPWLDGFKTGEGVVRQFVAMPLGRGYSVEAQLTGTEYVGGIQIDVYEAKPGRFSDQPPPAVESGVVKPLSARAAMPGMGLGAGGLVTQRVYPDPYGIETWNMANAGSVFIHILNSRQYRAVTGREPPPTPLDAKTYLEHGFPWFELYDEPEGDVPASERLSRLKSVQELEAEKEPAAGEKESAGHTEPIIERLRHKGKNETGDDSPRTHDTGRTRGSDR